MAEMILPGTYIEVRDEGLISAGPISIGNVGIVGTARRGRLGNPSGTDAPVVYTPSDLGEARDIFGGYDAFDNPLEPNQPLTLVRAMELAYANGAQRVFAVRVAAGGATSAVYTFAATTNSVSAIAQAPGTGYNGQTSKQNGGTPEDNASLKVVESGTNLLNVTFTVGRLVETWRDVPAAAADFVKVINGEHVGYPYSSKSSGGGGSKLFKLDAGSGATAATGNITIADAATHSTTAAQTTQGTDGAAATEADYKAGLDAIANEDVHIVVLAGQDTSLADSLAGHVQSASTDLMKRERIGVIGGTATDLSSIKTNVPGEDGGRIIFVAPGLKVNDAATGKEVSLPGTYAAAAVAGRIASLDPHISPTNKTVNTSGLQKVYNGTELEQLILNRVLALENRNGSFRIVKGITTSENTAWAQITTRRIVDYARFGVRSACQSYIGKLNNDRVRQAMKGTINGFLADMVDREMLISYDLDVSATREQQIRGIAQVTMTIRPTFSIDYIRVVMYLQ